MDLQESNENVTEIMQEQRGSSQHDKFDKNAGRNDIKKKASLFWTLSKEKRHPKIATRWKD